jgi:hypothetical protein
MLRSRNQSFVAVMVPDPHKKTQQVLQNWLVVTYMYCYFFLFINMKRKTLVWA